MSYEAPSIRLVGSVTEMTEVIVEASVVNPPN